MESPKRPATYTEYPRKPATETEDTTNWMSLASLICGLISVLSSSKLLGWISLFCGIASLTWLRFDQVDKFNVFVTLGFSVMSIISTYFKSRVEMLAKK
ncbi:hypothetical protein WA588_001662 [Blastocystis sp. NMH]